MHSGMIFFPAEWFPSRDQRKSGIDCGLGCAQGRRKKKPDNCHRRCGTARHEFGNGKEKKTMKIERKREKEKEKTKCINVHKALF